MTGGIIRTEGLTVGYGKKVVVDGVEIEARRGEIISIIGPNGAGKSTILKTIAAQLAGISGAVYISGRNMDSMSRAELSRTMSVMLTERIDTELMTCCDVVKTGRYPYTNQFGILSQEDRDRIKYAMDLTSVSELADADFSQISDGQRQRVMLAKAICQDPDILILDEPTSFLDIHHKLVLLSMLKRLVRERGIAVIMSMHELDLAQRISDRVIAVAGNRVDRCDAPEKIFTDEYITSLYHIGSGTYCSVYGSVELERCMGAAEVFVIAGGGSGVDTFRQLQRRGTPFASGIIYENDIDYHAASALSCEIVSEKAFEPVSGDKLERAIAIIESCRRVICCVSRFGTLDSANRRLYEYSSERGYLIPGDGTF